MSRHSRLISSTAVPAVAAFLLLLLLSPAAAPAQDEEVKPLISPAASPPDAAEMAEPQNAMRPLLERFAADMEDYGRIYEIRSSGERFEVLEGFLGGWSSLLDDVDFASLNVDGRIDYVLFANLLGYRLRRLEIERQRLDEALPLVPFAETIIRLQESRRRMEDIDPAGVAATLNELAKQIGARRAELQKQLDVDELRVKPVVAVRAAGVIEDLLETLRGWYGFYNGYDPLFTWWAELPFKAAEATLADYATWLRESVAGISAGDEATIVGDPVGREALVAELAYSKIPYSPEELMEIGRKEYDWCEAEMIKASRELGFGDDWLKALEHVKTLHVEPGRQPAMIRDLALEAIDFIESRDLITVPRLAKDTWRMEMMSPEAQLVNPFFLGGPTIIVSFPTNTMAHEDKLMSLRGNNVHFARATVFHELIPGHHLQFFMLSRHNTHRRVFSTPFWIEGWALHWEMLLWDQGFAQSPENRIGMLFWRMHRCARIIFSLGFHLGTMTPQECIDFLVERVGHERANATAEVRRSFESHYGPLYQLAYLTGGLQFRALHRELVGSGVMSEREFHDKILRIGNIPVEMVRARLLGQEINKDFTSSWRFYGDPVGAGGR